MCYLSYNMTGMPRYGLLAWCLQNLLSACVCQYIQDFTQSLIQTLLFLLETVLFRSYIPVSFKRNLFTCIITAFLKCPVNGAENRSTTKAHISTTYVVLTSNTITVIKVPYQRKFYIKVNADHLPSPTQKKSQTKYFFIQE